MVDRVPNLLVSVRSAEEARAALAGGADLIDVKEPARGPLGAADFEVAEAVVATVMGRAAVSVAGGEWETGAGTRVPAGVSYVKWGLAGLKQRPRVAANAIRRCPPPTRPVLVAYADFQRAHSPATAELVELAIQLRFPALLIDTAVKDGSSLTDWIDLEPLTAMRLRLGAANVSLALAGSLDADAIRRLAAVRPDWFAVRGAACVGGRGGSVCPDRVRALRAVIRSDQTASRAR